MIRYQNKAIKFYHTNMKILFIDIYIWGGGGCNKIQEKNVENFIHSIMHIIFSILYFSSLDPGTNPTGLCEWSQWAEWRSGVHTGRAGEGSQGEGQPAGKRTQKGFIIQQGRCLYQWNGAKVMHAKCLFI